jgi:transposase-like protein
MKRPDLATLACGNPACQRLRLAGQDHRTVRKVYGQAPSRLLRCRTCGEACSERRGTAVCHTKLAEARAASVVDHRGAGCGGRAPARLVHVAQDTGARRLRTAGRHAERLPAYGVRDVPPRAVEVDAQWSFVQKSSSAARWRSAPRLAPWGTIRRSPPTAHGSWRSSAAHGPKNQPGPWGTMPRNVSVRGLCRGSSPMPLKAMRRPSSTPVDVALRPPAPAPQARPVVPSYAGPKAERMGR